MAWPFFVNINRHYIKRWLEKKLGDIVLLLNDREEIDKVHTREILQDEGKMTKLLQAISGFCKETFRVKKNPAGEIDIGGIVAIVLVSTFATTVIIQACGWGTVPDVLERPMDIALGWVFGMGYSKFKAKRNNSQNK